MEIPYIVTPRKDTGLFNAKIAIWLFLASEVMLFGGFFSAYVFLRVDADYPWPERTLPVLPGLINTFVLIGSSVTVVFAWASLKLRQWRRFQIFMGITVACAAIFMALKAVEYNVKFHHQALRMKDFTVVEGHLGVEKENGVAVLDHKGNEIEENVISIEATKVTFNTLRAHKPWVEEILAEVAHNKAKITLAADFTSVMTAQSGNEARKPETIAKAGEPLSYELIERIAEAYKKARTNNAEVRTQALSDAWVKVHDANPDKRDWQIGPVNIELEPLAPQLLGVLAEGEKIPQEVSTVAFNIDKATRLDFHPRDIREDLSPARLRDDTVVEGKMDESAMVFHRVDAIDFQHLVMKAEEKGIEPEVAIENSWLLKNSPEAKEAWEWHQKDVEKLKAELIKDHGFDKNGKPRYVPTHKELYRIGWQDFARRADESGLAKLGSTDAFIENFKGPNYDARDQKTFPELTVPREMVGHASKFTPAWNNYYAIYFTITGLHGLHVIAGALVLAYYLFFGKKMYLTNPEWLANRVEIGGLFWHFVDLVWIFVFPILYLM